MVNTTSSLKNVNLLSKAQFDAISNPAEDELWAVECEPLGVPSDTYVELSVLKTAVGTYTYTAPANGYVNFTFTHGTSGSATTMKRNGLVVCSTSTQGHRSFLATECKKGDMITIVVGTNALYSIDKQYFFYAEGEI